MKRWFWLPLAVLMLWPAAAVAQEETAAPTWWAVFTEEVAPENVAAFEENAAKMHEVIAAHAPERIRPFLQAVWLGDRGAMRAGLFPKTFARDQALERVTLAKAA